MENIDAFYKDTIEKNSNLNQKQKELMKFVINKYNNTFLNVFDVDMNLDNVSQLLSSINIISDVSKESDKSFYYEPDNNIIIDNSVNVSADNRKMYDYCDAVLEVISRKYNPDTEKYDKGLVYENSNGRLLGIKINDKVKSSIILNILGENPSEESIEDFYCDTASEYCTLDDRIMFDMYNILSAKEMLTYFINAEGEQFFQRICEGFDDELQAVEFFENIDSYNKENSIKNRAKYDEQMKMLKENIFKQENSINL